MASPWVFLKVSSSQALNLKFLRLQIPNNYTEKSIVLQEKECSDFVILVVGCCLYFFPYLPVLLIAF